MRARSWILAASFIIFLFLASGCATRELPGGADEVTEPLRGIDLHTKRPRQGELYPTASRDRLFASDREIYVVSHWALPRAGVYGTHAVVRTPAGEFHRTNPYVFAAHDASWWTSQRIPLPQGKEAQPLAGRWEVEVVLDGTTRGRRSFTFDPGSIRLRTDARVAIAQGKADFAGNPGEWRWRYPSIAKERTEAASRMFGVMLRDELTRRFPKVAGPESTPQAAETTVLLTPTLLISPDIDGDSRLELEVADLATKAVRTFSFKTSRGRERLGDRGVLRFDFEAVDLAARAASSLELLDFLMRTTQAVPE
jgi:hypothetical protein